MKRRGSVGSNRAPVLTPAMVGVLRQLSAQEQPACAQELGVRITTVESLEIKGLLRKERGAGSYAYPLTGILWRITDAGRSWVEAHPEQGERAARGQDVGPGIPAHDA